MKKLVITTMAIFMAVLMNVTTAQTLQEVLEKHFKTIGQEQLLAANSFYIKAKVSQMGMDLPMEMKIKKPGKFITTIDFQGQKIITAFDGEKGWMINPMMGAEPQDLAGDQLAQAQSQADMDGELYNYEAKEVRQNSLVKLPLKEKNFSESNTPAKMEMQKIILSMQKLT